MGEGAKGTGVSVTASDGQKIQSKGNVLFHYIHTGNVTGDASSRDRWVVPVTFAIKVAQATW